MNIFILEKNNQNIDWHKSAQSLDNYRLPKMIVESAQILSTVINENPTKLNIPLYKTTHRNHPCVKWAETSFENFKSVLNHAFYMCEAYEKRFNKTHKTKEVLETMKNCRWKDLEFKRIDFTKPFLCMDEVYRSEDVVESYRNFYANKPNIRYNMSDIPDWFLEKRKLPFEMRTNNDSKYFLYEVW